MTHFHAVAWIDHSEAHVFQLNEDTAERTLVHASGKHRHIHHRSGTLGSGKAPEDVAYLDSVAQALEGATQILVMGPANEKHVLKKPKTTKQIKTTLGRTATQRAKNNAKPGRYQMFILSRYSQTMIATSEGKACQ